MKGEEENPYDMMWSLWPETDRGGGGRNWLVPRSSGATTEIPIDIPPYSIVECKKGSLGDEVRSGQGGGQVRVRRGVG